METSFKLNPIKAYSSLKTPQSKASQQPPHVDSEIPQLLALIQSESYELIISKDFENAIPKLKKLEQILEALIIQGTNSDSDLILATIHNIALCYQRIGDLEKCIAYLEGCLFNVNKFGAMNSCNTLMEGELKRNLYKIKLYVQSCAVLSQLEKHKKALDNAKNALKLSLTAIRLTIQACKAQLKKYKALKQRNSLITDDLRKSYKVIYMSYPAIKALRKYLLTGSLNHHQKIRSVLGIKDDPDWLKTLTISDIMFMQPYTTEDLKQSLGLQVEFTNDYLLYKICLLAVSHFCISTELRYMSAYDDAKKAHKKSVEILEYFIPDVSPLRIHIEECYKKRFGEDEIMLNQTADNIHTKKRNSSMLPSIIERPESLSPRLAENKNKHFNATLRPHSVLSKGKVTAEKRKNATMKLSELKRKNSNEEIKLNISARLDWG
ncbi:unnamed protein product [Blepharisma stoltei]|uniref:Signal recognition particle subunit SRP72 n=1 Tax=Blepharisma stoltei TaxID=1481888 RepID=A0AAU9IA22_9CILI|nr:unnamed protein product [Blepharisma stoltei]